MAKAEIHEVLSVSKEKLYAAIIRYEDYPQFVDGVKEVQVERKGAGKARVRYKVNVIKEVTYTLDLVEDETRGEVSWTLVESDFFKKNVGRWQLKDAGAGKTDVQYELEVEFKIPVPGLILNRLVKGSLPPMLKNFEKRARNG